MTLRLNPETSRYEGVTIAVTTDLLERRVRDALARGEREDIARAWLSQERWWSRSSPGVEAIPRSPQIPLGLGASPTARGVSACDPPTPA